MKIQMWKTLTVALFVALLSFSPVRAEKLPGQKLPSGTLKILITGLRNDKGTIRIGLFNSKETFSKKGEAVRTAAIKPDSREALASFEDLPYGSYAVSLYHDENDNDKYNLGLVLISRERYGFSNNVKPGFKGPPPFEAAMFMLRSNEQTFRIKVQ